MNINKKARHLASKIIIKDILSAVKEKWAIIQRFLKTD